MILDCIRHGESLYNAEGRIQGHIDIPLSELGWRQAEAAADALRGEPIEAVFSSPLTRAVQTAEIVAAGHHLPVECDARLMEIAAGLFQGRLRSDLDRLYPLEFGRWMSGDVDFAIPFGESRRELMLRGLAAFRTIAGRNFRQIAVVSHGGLLTAVLKELLADSPRLSPFALENGSITRIEIDRGAGRLVAMGQTEHLAEVGLAGGGDL